MCLFFFIVVLCLTPLSVEAGTIKGTVRDSLTGSFLTGVTIRIENTTLYDISGLDGSYKIKDIPDGTYTLIISYISYVSLVRRIKIGENKTIIINANLKLRPGRQLKGITVMAEKSYSNDISARSAEHDNIQLTNIVSGRIIKISPGNTVVNAVRKIPGISIERDADNDGNYALVRGMDKRYNYVMINGVKIPSPDNAYRYVPLNIFPLSLLARIELYKTLTSDMEGDALGGVINMITREAPDDMSGSVYFAAGYNQIFFNRTLMTYDAGGIDEKSPYQRYGSRYNADEKDFSKAAMDYSTRNPLPDLSGGFSLSNRFLKNKLGAVIAGAVQTTGEGNNSLFFDSEVVDTLKGVTLTNLNERKYSDRKLRYGAYAQVDYRLNENSKLKWYSTFINLTNIQVRDSKTTLLTIGGYDPVNGDATLEYAVRSRVTTQQMLNNVIQGNHRLSDNLELKWSAVYSVASKKQPDNTTILLNGTEKRLKDKRTTIKNASRRWDQNTDRDLAAYLNITYEKQVAGMPVKLEAGGLFRYKHRNNFYNEYYFRPVNAFAEYGEDFDDYTEISWVVENPRGSVASPLNYDAFEKTADGYLQFNIQEKRLELNGGLRLESIRQGYKMRFPIGTDAPSRNKIYTNILPSIYFKYLSGKKTDLRISYFRSVNRPGYFEIVPYIIVNEDYTEAGNPDLQEAIADNIGVCYEYFPDHEGEFRIDVFYKHIQNPIEYTLQSDSLRGQDIYYTPGNFGNTRNFGGGVNYIKYFNKIGVKINYTYTHSGITTAKSKRIRDKDGNLKTIKVNETRPLCGQSAHIANLSLLYKNTKNGWDAQLTTNYTGKRINTVSQFAGDNLWQKAFIHMDMSIEKRLKTGIALFMKASNLLNYPMILYIKNTSSRNSGKPYQDVSNGITLIRRDHYGQTFNMGIRYTW